MTIAAKRMFALIWNFFTMKSLKFSHWFSCLLASYLFPPWSPEKEVIWKGVLPHSFQNMSFLLLIKLGLHVKTESCSYKINQAMDIVAHQGEAKSQNHKIFKSLYLAQFFNLFSKFLHVSCYYTNQQVVYSNMGSNMVPLGGGDLWGPLPRETQNWICRGR